jgi:hypothetical protein
VSGVDGNSFSHSIAFFMYGRLNDIVSSSDDIVLNVRMIVEQ